MSEQALFELEQLEIEPGPHRAPIGSHDIAGPQTGLFETDVELPVVYGTAVRAHFNQSPVNDGVLVQPLPVHGTISAISGPAQPTAPREESRRSLGSIHSWREGDNARPGHRSHSQDSTLVAPSEPPNDNMAGPQVHFANPRRQTEQSDSTVNRNSGDSEDDENDGDDPNSSPKTRRRSRSASFAADVAKAAINLPAKAINAVTSGAKQVVKAPIAVAQGAKKAIAKVSGTDTTADEAAVDNSGETPGNGESSDQSIGTRQRRRSTFTSVLPRSKGKRFCWEGNYCMRATINIGEHERIWPAGVLDAAAYVDGFDTVRLVDVPTQPNAKIISKITLSESSSVPLSTYVVESLQAISVGEEITFQDTPSRRAKFAEWKRSRGLS